MRRGLTLTILVLLTSHIFLSVQAQDTLFHEGFQSGDLNGFMSLDLDGLPLSDDFLGFGLGFEVAAVAGPMDFRAVGISSFQDPGGQADNWLISPPISVAGGAVQLSWVASSLSGDPAQRESYEVLLSRTGTEMEDFTDILAIVAAESASGDQRSVSLAPYIGSTVHIAFRHLSMDRLALTVDDILVTSSPALSADFVRFGGDKYQTLADRDLFLEIVNTGSDTIRSVTISGSINGAAGDFSFADLMVAPGETAQLSFSDLFPFEADKYLITGNITALNGEGFLSDEGAGVFHLISGGPDQRPLVQLSTSTTCGQCPADIVALQNIALQPGPDPVILNAHLADPMETPAFVVGLINSPGYLGLPSASINRSINEFSTQIAGLLEQTTAPVTLTLEQQYDPSTRSLTAVMQGTSHTGFDPEDIRLSLIIVEDSVNVLTPDFAQANDFSFEALDQPLVGPDGRDWQGLTNPVPPGLMTYDAVVRDVVGSYEGIVGSVPAVTLDDTFSWEVVYQLPSTFDENNIMLVVAAIDAETGAVVNVEEVALDFVSSVDDTPELDFALFPNPVGSTLYVDGSDIEGVVAYEVVGVDGVHWQSGLNSPAGERLVIDCADLPVGLYMLRIQVGQKASVHRFTVGRG